MEVFPSILVDTFEEFETRIRLVEEVASLFHLDAGDGLFAPRASFRDVAKISGFAWKKPFELHLMLASPQTSVLSWLETPAQRIIFHWEATQGPHTWVHGFIRKIKVKGKEVGIALNPKTSQEKIYSFLNEIDLILIMSVEPGFSGQKFIPEVLSKITALRGKRFSGMIEIDGGMNEETMKLAKDAGADAAAAASAIFDAPEPREAFARLKNQIM